MAYGLHWEWRGFGGVSVEFAKRYLLLPSFYELSRVEDKYFWIPGMEVNAKFRTGEQAGLKFKRLKDKQGNYEVWLEDEEELFAFPLGKEAWEALVQIFEKTDVRLPDPKLTPVSKKETITILEHAGCKIVAVAKERETRLLEQQKGDILVEWTAIQSPRPCISVGLECWSEDQNANLSGSESLRCIQEALSALNLHKEPLQSMSYLEAVKYWATENKI